MGLASAANKPAALSKKGIVSIAIYIDDSVAMNKKRAVIRFTNRSTRYSFNFWGISWITSLP